MEMAVAMFILPPSTLSYTYIIVVTLYNHWKITVLWRGSVDKKSTTTTTNQQQQNQQQQNQQLNQQQLNQQQQNHGFEIYMECHLPFDLIDYSFVQSRFTE